MGRSWLEPTSSRFLSQISKTPSGKEKIKPESEEILKYALDNNIDPNIISKRVVDFYEKNIAK